jgi:hypothetical protein
MSEINYFENELMADLAKDFSTGRIEFLSDDKQYIALMKKKYAWIGNQIDWNHTANHFEIDLEQFENQAEKFEEFIFEMLAKFSIASNENVIVSTLSDAIRSLQAEIGTLVSGLSTLLSIPDHLYIYPKDARWCFLCDDLREVNFGFSLK